MERIGRILFPPLNPAEIRIRILVIAVLLIAVVSFAIHRYARNNGFPRTQKAVPHSTATPKPSAAVETWSPTITPGEKPDLQKILNEAKELMGRGQYEEALQRQIWYHNHAREYDQGQTGVRLSFALSQWDELGRRYPKAKDALIEIRDRNTRKLVEGNGYVDLFIDVQAINRELGNDDATYALFKTIREKDPKLAQQCYFWVESLLVSKGEYQWCYDHMGDPQSRFDLIKSGYEMQISSQKRMEETLQRSRRQMEEIHRKNGMTNTPIFSPPDSSAMMKKSAEDRFVGQVGQLIEILVATGHTADAEKIREQALAVLDDARLKSAVEAAEERVKERGRNGNRRVDLLDLREAKAKLAELRVEFTEDHPQVKAQLALLHELERMTKEQPDASPALREAKAKLAKARIEFTDTHPEVRKLIERVRALEDK